MNDNKNNKHETSLDRVAGNGLLSRRHLLGLSLAGAGAAVAGNVLGAEAPALSMPAWSRSPGRGPSEYGNPSTFAAGIKRLAPPPNATLPGGGASRTPLHLMFSYEDLLAYPMESRILFLECSGNSGGAAGPTAADTSAGGLHGLLSCAEWTGVRLSTLLDEAGVLPEASWVSSTGADGASLGRSIPLNKALRDVFIALYQNGEPIRPEQGYPMRLFVPGWEGNVSVKWLTQIKLTDMAANFKDETSRYTELLPDGKALQFTFPMGTKSVITSPSGQMTLRRQGIHEITGLAWSGRGAIRRVEVSADGGRSWADAHLEPNQLELALARFRLPWLWEGGPAVLQSRATDSAGNVQPTREVFLNTYSPANRYHFNGIQSWAVSAQGEVKNVYA